MSITIVTGTDTGVGKTIASAALAVHASRSGSTLVIKPTQTGMNGSEPSDAAEVTRLSGVPALTTVTLADPLAPDTAARLSDTQLPTVRDHAAIINEHARTHQTLIVEGAGGLLVHLDHEGNTIAELAMALPGSQVVVVTSLKLGTLNHTALTLEALTRRDIEVAGLVIGSVPAKLGLAERCNRHDLSRHGLPILAEIPAGAGAMTRQLFTAAHAAWFTDHNPQDGTKVSS